jgi:hypothetical protein
MNDFEEKDGKLIYICSHEWGKWYNVDYHHETEPSVSKRHCYKCTETQLLVPKGYGEVPEKKGIVSKILSAIGLK